MPGAPVPGALPGASPDAAPVQPAGPDGERQAPGAEGALPPQSTEPERSLAATQQARCANAGFLTRFVCDERVRLEYCENRWNRHPDCMLDNGTTF